MGQGGEVLDLKGLKCPMPALLARKRLERMASGAMLTVLADDPMAYIDVPHMARSHAYEVVSTERDGAVARIVLRKP